MKMNRVELKTFRTSIRWLLVLGLWMGWIGQTAAKNPNVIFIMTDDLGIGKLAPYGFNEEQIIRTPHINRLAAEGMIFTSCYSGSAVCGPSRASLISGRHPGHCGIRGNTGNRKVLGDMWPPKAGEALGSMAQRAGYATACFGKIGAGGKVPLEEMQQEGWDYWAGFLDHINAYQFYPKSIWKNGEKFFMEKNATPEMEELLSGPTQRRLIPEELGTYSEDYFTDEILAFIRAQTQAEKPFFIYFGSQVSHGGKPGLSVPSLEGFDQHPANLTWDEQVYAACISRHDKNVGRIMALLKELSIDEETLIIWTADNGDEDVYYSKASERDIFNGNGPYKGKKRWLAEGGIRVPGFARWPGQIQPGSTSDFPWASWDLIPTIADIAGKPELASFSDGISILPTLRGKPSRQTSREYLYWEFYTRKATLVEELGPQQAVRMGVWKAYRAYPDNTPSAAIELYNLDDDREETNNLAAQYPEMVRKMEAIMEAEHHRHPYWELPGEAAQNNR